MKKTFSILMALVVMVSLLTTTVSAAPTVTATPTTERGQLKICKVAGSGVTEGKLFAFRVGGTTYTVPAGPRDRNGYCVLAGQYPLGTQLTIEEVIPGGYYVSMIEIKPDSNRVSRTTSQGLVTVKIGSGVTEVIYTNKVIGPPTPTRTPTSIHSPTPRPTKTSTPVPACAPNCTPTPTPIPTGRLQICKDAEGEGVSGAFTFKFGTRSRTVPVGACAGLISVYVGTLTITEVAQSGYSVADIYTIPASRLISKDLNGRSVTVRIVEGTAASQTIVVFRNRAVPATATFTPTNTATATPTFTSTATPTFTATGTPTFTPTSTATSTPTNTPTGTITPPSPTFTPTGSVTPTVCVPTLVRVDLSKFAPGASIEGMSVAYPGLNIDAKGKAIKILEGTQPATFGASTNNALLNGGLTGDGGFSDLITQSSIQPHLYTFTFAPGTAVSSFSLRMLDFGDLDPTLSTSHYAKMTAFNASGVEIGRQELNYNTTSPYFSPVYGSLFVAGDAINAQPGQPGKWTWQVNGSGITKVVLEFGAGFDPNIGFDTLSFMTECVVSCQTVDFSKFAPGASVEGMNVAATGLNIDAKGKAIKILEGTQPATFGASTNNAILNGGLTGDGGFSDLITQSSLQPHLYTFTFDVGTSVKSFSLRMLDFGDLDPTLSTAHFARMTAYNASGAELGRQEMNYTTTSPYFSPLYGSLFVAGDAINAQPGQPGKWTWKVNGNGIRKIVLEFGAGFDPNIGFDTLTFCQ